MIRFKALSKTWPDGTQAVTNVSLDIPHGQFCVILGPSGAGKSTLLRAVNGLMKPTQGSVSIDGVELSASSERALRQRVAMIHQLAPAALAGFMIVRWTQGLATG